MKSVVISSRDRHVLSMLGSQVRRARTGHGITRKELARQSGVSERYLAQLEAGEGNASILLLKHISDALNLSVTELLVGSFNTDQQKKHIALVGLRGAGKSTLGTALAKKLNKEFIEIDKKIESLAGITLSEIFSLYGQEGYRRFEKACLAEVLNQPEGCIIETGGSVVTDKASYDMILSSCFTIWIKAKAEDHMIRVINQGDTRIISSTLRVQEDVQEILQNREPLYELADKTINTSIGSIAQCLTELAEFISGSDEGGVKYEKH